MYTDIFETLTLVLYIPHSGARARERVSVFRNQLPNPWPDAWLTATGTALDETYNDATGQKQIRPSTPNASGNARSASSPRPPRVVASFSSRRNPIGAPWWYSKGLNNPAVGRWRTLSASRASSHHSERSVTYCTARKPRPRIIMVTQVQRQEGSFQTFSPVRLSVRVFSKPR
jgi:hypothetical protein